MLSSQIAGPTHFFTTSNHVSSASGSGNGVPSTQNRTRSVSDPSMGSVVRVDEMRRFRRRRFEELEPWKVRGGRRRVESCEEG